MFLALVSLDFVFPNQHAVDGTAHIVKKMPIVVIGTLKIINIHHGKRYVFAVGININHHIFNILNVKNKEGKYKM